jgi:hypothetical protein
MTTLDYILSIALTLVLCAPVWAVAVYIATYTDPDDFPPKNGGEG